MARGDKNYDKVVRGVVNKKSSAKIQAVHKMVEALINNDNDAAVDELHKYLSMKARELLLGEEEEKEEDDKKSDDSSDDEKEEKDDEKSEDKSDDDDDDDDDEKSEDKSDDDDDDDDDDEKKSEDKKEESFNGLSDKEILEALDTETLNSIYTIVVGKKPGLNESKAEKSTAIRNNGIDASGGKFTRVKTLAYKKFGVDAGSKIVKATLGKKVR